MFIRRLRGEIPATGGKESKQTDNGNFFRFQIRRGNVRMRRGVVFFFRCGLRPNAFKRRGRAFGFGYGFAFRDGGFRNAACRKIRGFADCAARRLARGKGKSARRFEACR